MASGYALVGASRVLRRFEIAKKISGAHTSEYFTKFKKSKKFNKPKSKWMDIHKQAYSSVLRTNLN